ESWRLLARNMLPVPWGVHVHVRIGEPIARRPGEDQEALIEQVREEIASTLSRWRGEDAAAGERGALRDGTGEPRFTTHPRGGLPMPLQPPARGRPRPPPPPP